MTPRRRTGLRIDGRRGHPDVRAAATGDDPRLRRARGRYDALAAYLVSLSHEVVHNRQWCETGDFTERGVAVRARKMVASYLATAKRP